MKYKRSHDYDLNLPDNFMQSFERGGFSIRVDKKPKGRKQRGGGVNGGVNGGMKGMVGGANPYGTEDEYLTED